MIAPNLESIIHGIFQYAKMQRHEFVTIEHLLHGLLSETQTKQTLTACGADVLGLVNILEKHIQSNTPIIPLEMEVVQTQPTLGFQRVLQRAIMHIQNAGKNHVEGVDLLVAIFNEKDSHAMYFLQKQNISRLDIINYLSHGITKQAIISQKEGDKNNSASNGNNYARGSGNSSGAAGTPGAGQNSHSINHSLNQGHTASGSGDEMEQFLINLNEQVLRGKIDPLIGRHDEVERTIQILCRRRKNNPLLVGEAGVGKTAIAEGLAYQIVQQKVPAVLRDGVVYSVDMCQLLAGTRYRGDFEQRIKQLVQKIKSLPNAILFIDEIHTLIGAGASSGSSVDAGNLLKPVLSSGELRCIGATTFDEYRKLFEKEAALSRRFQKVEVLEPSRDDTIRILQGLKSRFEDHHNVRYEQDAIAAAVDLSIKYINDRFLPDKAIDVLDEAGARLQMMSRKRRQTIDRRQIEAVVAKIARVPVQTIGKDDRQKLKTLSSDMKELIFGQDEAIDALSASIKMSKAGLGNENKPIGAFLFAGPTGVGKTEVAKQLANVMGIDFVRFDMSEYMERHAVSRLIGSPPGYVGYEEGGLLTEAVNKKPHCVLLLDEIEKAHPDIFNLLLQVMDHGTLTDNNGRKANFKNMIIIMTSNVGAQENQKNVIGFTTAKTKEDNTELKRVFSPEFRNRLSGVIEFNGLTPSVIMHVVNKFLRQLDVQLLQKGVQAEFTNTLKNYLAEKGYDPKMGARPMERLIQNAIRKALSDELLFGCLSQGGYVCIDVINDEVVLKFNQDDAPKHQQEKVMV